MLRRNSIWDWPTPCNGSQNVAEIHLQTDEIISGVWNTHNGTSISTRTDPSAVRGAKHSHESTSALKTAYRKRISNHSLDDAINQVHLDVQSGSLSSLPLSRTHAVPMTPKWMIAANARGQQHHLDATCYSVSGWMWMNSPDLLFVELWMPVSINIVVHSSVKGETRQ